MIQEKMIEDVVRSVLQNLAGESLGQNSNKSADKLGVTRLGLDPDKDYPLANKRPELVKSPTGKTLQDITLEKVLDGKIKGDDVTITPETLRMQAEIAEGVNRIQLANNMRRASELTAVPDDRILEMYNALRPRRSTKRELLDIANELETKYGAKICANFVREAADVYERRNILRTE